MDNIPTVALDLASVLDLKIIFLRRDNVRLRNFAPNLHARFARFVKLQFNDYGSSARL